MDKREMSASRWLIIRKLISLVFLWAQVHVGSATGVECSLEGPASYQSAEGRVWGTVKERFVPMECNKP